MTEPPQNMLIELDNLSVIRQGHHLLRNIQLSLPAQGLVVVLGANGAGKSSLLRVLAGVSEATAGTIRYRSDVRIGWMPEPASFYPQLTVHEQLLLWADLQAVEQAQTAVEQMMTDWGLVGVRNQTTLHLSLGYRQRLSLAMALLPAVDVLLLDEPMNGMDPDLMQQFKNRLTELKQRHLVILVTHLMAEVSVLSDWVLVMQQGQIILQQDVRTQNIDAVGLMNIYQQAFQQWQQQLKSA